MNNDENKYIIEKNEDLIVMLGSEEGRELMKLIMNSVENYEVEYTIIFPKHILGIATSLSRGMIGYAIDKKKLDWFINYVTISGNKGIKEKFDSIIEENYERRLK